MPASSVTTQLSSSSSSVDEHQLSAQFQSSVSLTPSKSQHQPSKNASGHTIEEMMIMRGLKVAPSQNVTESVPVPSSEHVAEIVGRQGCKIKALRAKTNTYIKTPIRGEAPMFVITGRKEDVQTAKREIQLAADHFSQIRARRGSSSSSGGGGGNGYPNQSDSSNSISVIQGELVSPSSSTKINENASLVEVNPNPNGSSSSSSGLSSPINKENSNKIVASHRSNSASPTNADPIAASPKELTLTQRNLNQTAQPNLLPGQIVKKVEVPYQVVGLVVGPKGSTIKRIQQNTNTYIVTPSRDCMPVFEIQGMPDNVEAAKIEIENYILLRTTAAVPMASSAQLKPNGMQQLASSSSSTSSQLVSTHNGSNLMNDYEDFYANTLDIDDLKLETNVSSLISATGAPISAQVSGTKCSLLSPQSSSLFQSVVSVVDDFIPSSSIWSSELYSAQSSSSSKGNDFLVNSLQQTLNGQMMIGNTLNSINGTRSSSSSSSSTSSSFSSSANEANNNVNISSNTNAGVNNSSSFLFETSNLGNMYDFGNMMMMSNLDSSAQLNGSQLNAPFGYQQTASSSLSSSSSSSSSSHNDMILNSIFQHADKLNANPAFEHNYHHLHHPIHESFNYYYASNQQDAAN